MTRFAEKESFALKPDAMVTVLEEGAVLLDLETKYFYAVNSSGWAILQMCESGTSRHEVHARCRSWDVDQDGLADVDRFLDILVAENLLAPTDGAPAAGPAASTGPWEPPSISKQKEPLQRIMASAFDPSLPMAE